MLGITDVSPDQQRFEAARCGVEKRKLHGEYLRIRRAPGRPVPALSPAKMKSTGQFPQRCPHLCRTLSPIVHLAGFGNYGVRRTELTGRRRCTHSSTKPSSAETDGATRIRRLLEHLVQASTNPQ